MTKLKEEFFKILPPTIYFFVALHLVMFIRVLMLEGTGVSPYSSASIALTALVLGKAVLLADMLPLINRFPNKPLIYNIAWKTAIYLLISAVLHYLERLIDFWRETGSFVAGNEKLLSLIVWPHFFAIQILLFVLIAMYCTVHELVRGNRQGKGSADILWTAPCAGSVIPRFRTRNHTVSKKVSEFRRDPIAPKSPNRKRERA